MGNSRNDFIGFNNEETPDERPKKIGKLLKQFKARRSFVIAGVIALFSVFALVYLRPHLIPFLPDNQKGKEYAFSKDRVDRVKKELLIKNKYQHFTQQEIDQIVKSKPTGKPVDKSVHKDKHLYEIELFSGGTFYAENTVITGDKITFVNGKGLIVTINRYDVKKIKRL